MKKFYTLLMSVCMVTLFADGPMPDCAFTAEEKAFAIQLTEANLGLFCHMTSDQRSDCMQMVEVPDASGSPVTADQAVEKMAPAVGSVSGSM